METIDNTQHNQEPKIEIDNIHIRREDITLMGKNKDTVKIISNGMTYIKFKAQDFIDNLGKYDKMSINIVGRANLNSWMGRITPQIFIDDYAISDLRFSF